MDKIEIQKIVTEITKIGIISDNYEDWFAIEINKDYHFIVCKRKMNKNKTRYIGDFYNDKQLKNEIKKRWSEVKPIYEKLGVYSIKH